MKCGKICCCQNLTLTTHSSIVMSVWQQFKEALARRADFSLGLTDTVGRFTVCLPLFRENSGHLGLLSGNHFSLIHWEDQRNRSHEENSFHDYSIKILNTIVESPAMVSLLRYYHFWIHKHMFTSVFCNELYCCSLVGLCFKK